MGDASAVPLLSGTRFIPGALSVGESLPKDTFLSGRLVLLFPFSPAHPVQLRFRLAAKFSAAIAPNDYVAATPSRRIKWTFNITISPNDEVRRSWANEKESLEGEHARLGGLMGKEVDVACDGLVVSEVSGTNVHLEAAGSRMMATEGMEPWTVFQGKQRNTQLTSFGVLAIEYTDCVYSRDSVNGSFMARDSQLAIPDRVARTASTRRPPVRLQTHYIPRTAQIQHSASSSRKAEGSRVRRRVQQGQGRVAASEKGSYRRRFDHSRSCFRAPTPYPSLSSISHQRLVFVAKSWIPRVSDRRASIDHSSSSTRGNSPDQRQR